MYFTAPTYDQIVTQNKFLSGFQFKVFLLLY